MTDTATSTEPTTYSVPTVLRVTRTVNLSGDDKAADSESSEILEVKQFVTQPAIVNFSYPIKRALEYQSVGLEVGVSLPCYAEEVGEGLKKAQEIVVKRTAELLPEVGAVLDKLVEQALAAKTAINRGTWSPSK